MTFHPQYSVWSKETFNSTGGADIFSPEDFNIIGGVTTLIPNIFNEGTHTFDAPWDPVTGWQVNNNMDSDPIVTGDLNQYDFLEGKHGHVGTTYQTAYFTSGNGSAVVYHPTGDVWVDDKLTLEFRVRAMPQNLTGGHDNPFSGDHMRHGVYIGDTGQYAFIEVLPEGLRVEGGDNWLVPGDYSSKLRKVRFVKDGESLTLMTDDETHTFYATGFTNHTTIQTGTYVSFGAFPVTGGDAWDSRLNPGTGNFHELPFERTTFSGLTLWDDIKIANGQAVTSLANDYIPPYPTGVRQINSAPFYPGPDVESFLAAYVKINPMTGGYTKLTFEHLVPTGNAGSGRWDAPSDVGQKTIQLEEDRVHFFDLTSIPAYSQPFQNSLRFVIESESYGGAAPEVEEILFIGKQPSAGMDAVPNWKLSSMAKPIYFTVNKALHDSAIPPAHHQDELYLHNKERLEILGIGSELAPIRFGAATGIVREDAIANSAHTGHFVGVDDGVYDMAWRGFNKINDFVGNWWSQSTDIIAYDTISGATQYQGTVVDVFSQYPTTGEDKTAGVSQVQLNVDQYQDFDGNPINVQQVIITNYTGTHDEHIGICMTGIFPPQTMGEDDHAMGVVQGVIQIERGPGVTVALHEHGKKHSVLLRGEDYRQPRAFACAAYYTGNFTGYNSESYVSFGALPRLDRTDAVPVDRYGEWTPKLELHGVTDFRLFSLTGEIVAHSYVAYTGSDASYSRKVEPFNNLTFISTGDAGNLKTLEEINELLSPGETGFLQLETDAPVFEGWFRPFGLREHADSTLAPLAQLKDDAGVGLEVQIDRDGKIYGIIDTEYDDASTSFKTEYENQFSFNSNFERVVWGDWNHIGIVLESKALGDHENNTAMPVAPRAFNHLADPHGARTCKVYMTINGKIASAVDVAGSTYTSLFCAEGALDSAANIPGELSAMPLLPRIARMKHGGTWNVVLGEKVFCDYDHVRFGVYDRAEALTHLLTRGSKALPPMITPDDALKPASPIPGSIGHLEMAHIIRLDEDSDYVGLDWGFAPSHASLVGGTGGSELGKWNLSPSFWTERVDGPYEERSALRLGPGARLELPYSSFDERVFNGTGSYGKDHDRLYDLTGDIDQAVTGDGYGYYRYSANSHLKMSTKIRPHRYPSTGVMDVLTFDMDSAEDQYGDGQVYVGLNTSGHVIAGTRFDFIEDVGPFEIGKLEIGEWSQMGIDIKLPEANDVTTHAHIHIYASGELGFSSLLLGQPGGSAVSIRGFPLGYHGSLTGDSKSVFRLGGDIPRDGRADDWRWRWNDYDVCDWVVGYGLDEIQPPDYTGWSWSGMTHVETQPGVSEVAIANGGVIGHVSGQGNYTTGLCVYPATVFDDAGEQLLWMTANGGNDYAGILRGGMPLFEDGLFMNAASYYAIWENDNADEILGSTDSPIQIGQTVPAEGINLALVSVSPWSSAEAVSSFDMSDENPDNITPKVHGDLMVSSFATGGYGLIAQSVVGSDDIIVSSTSLVQQDNPNLQLGYYTHLIGGERTAVYIDNALDHSEIAEDEAFWWENITKIEDAITLTRVDGTQFTFDEFPHKFIVDTTPPAIGGAPRDKAFTVLLIASLQNVGETVFIDFPSIDYKTDNINLQNREVYNPVPMMKRVIDPTQGMSGNIFVQTSAGLNGYDVTIFDGDMGLNYKADNQGDL